MASDWKLCGVAVLALLCLSYDLAFAKPNYCKKSDLDYFGDIPYPYPGNCSGYCESAGDPHYTTFDCLKYDFHDTCSGILVKNKDSSLAEIEFRAEFKKLPYHPGYTVIKSLELVYDDITNIKIDGDFFKNDASVTINGRVMTESIRTFVFSKTIQHIVKLFRYCNAVVVVDSMGFTIYWSDPYRLLIQTHPDKQADIRGKIHGTCGNFNDKKYDDFTTRGDKWTADCDEVGHSWKVDSQCQSCDDCKPCLPCKVNGPETAKEAEAICAMFTNGIILPCGENKADHLYKMCLNIICASYPERGGLCELINMNLDLCTADGVSVVIPDAICDLTVPGCFVGSIFVPVGESVYSTDCQKDCKCTSPNNVTCEPNAGCEVNERCEIRKTIRRCFCKRGYFLDRRDGKCYALSTFRVGGDPHYTLFDGTPINFQGKCTYKLAATKPDAPEQFTVVGTNLQPKPDKNVTVLAFTTIYVYDLVIKFSFDTSDIFVNGVRTTLPFNYKKGKVIIRRSGRGNRVVLKTDFGFRVIYDGVHCLYIRIPTIPFIDNVHGLCGLLSGTKDDDLMMPNGTIQGDTCRTGKVYCFVKGAKFNKP
ncbi:zonadhesin-like [Amphiura filiformis]|uniref:zonadhesin-like n=1 Tax=Amphiura filiformis TaxID=82378 RepID=UPI003B22730E